MSDLNEADNYYLRSELTEASLNEHAFETQPSLDAMVSLKIECEVMHKAIQRLPTIHRRRLALYYFGEMTYEQIEEMEGCIHSVARRSVFSAIDYLKKIWNKGVHFPRLVRKQVRGNETPFTCFPLLGNGVEL